MDLKTLQEKIGQMLDVTLERAKIERERVPYSRSDGFPQAILFLGPMFEVASIPAMWGNENEKYRLMGAVSETAKRTMSMAVILVTDTRWVESDKIAPLMGLPKPEDVGIEKWQDLYTAALKKKFNSYAGNMPPEWYSEALMVVAKGPGVGVIHRVAHYEKGANDSIKWVPASVTPDAVTMNLIPDWWC